MWRRDSQPHCSPQAAHTLSLSLAFMASSTATMRAPKQMEPRDVVAARVKEPDMIGKMTCRRAVCGQKKKKRKKQGD